MKKGDIKRGLEKEKNDPINYKASVIYDGETEIHSTENGIVNYRNLNL